MREKIYWNRFWKFNAKFEKSMLQKPMTEGEENITLPHTVCETPFHYFDESRYQCISCYQKVFMPDVSWQNKVVRLTFEGAAHEAKVFLNGIMIGEHHCGYTAFTVNLSENLKFGQENLLTVRLDSTETLDQPPFGFVVDYMTYGGLYREAYLTVTDRIYFENIFYQPEPEKISTEGLSGEEIKNLKIMGTMTSRIVLSKAGEKAAAQGRLSIHQYLNEKKILGNAPFSGNDIKAMVSDISLWDIESPVRYTVRTELLLDGEVVDQDSCSIGFRRMRFEKEAFYLNGRKVKIRGLNRHQSYAYVGYAMPESMQRQDAKILDEELGVNAVRTSHYPQSQYFIDECDKRGLFVFMEIPGWQHIGGEAWKEQAICNVRDMIEQYRNHPSIMIWGVRINESQDDDDFYEKTNAAVHHYDETRQTGGVRCNTAGKNTNIQEDVFTYNDFSHTGRNAGCLPKKKATNDMEKPYLITEYNGHMYPTKAFDWEEHRMEQMIRHANVLDAVSGEEDICGAFAWCMFDYNTHKDFGSGDRICYHGVMDMFRNPKLVAELYQAQAEKTEVLAVSSSMDIGEHPASNRGDTYIISNAESVRMYKNNVLLKEYFPKDSSYRHLLHGPILIDDYVGNMIAKEEGYSQKKASLVKYCLNTFSMNNGKVTLKLLLAALRLMVFYHLDASQAVPLYQKYIGDWGGASKQYRFDAVRGGKVVKSVICEPMKKAHLMTRVSSTVLIEDATYDVAEIRIQAVDENGNVLPYFQEALQVEIQGPLTLIGPEVVPLRGGMAGVYVKTRGEAGEAKIKLSGENIQTRDITLEVIIK